MRARNSGLRDMERQFPFLFGGTFIEGQIIQLMNTNDGHFPCFSEGLSLRQDDPTFSRATLADFPSFSEGLSLRRVAAVCVAASTTHFPSFWEGLSLRFLMGTLPPPILLRFPYLFGRTFNKTD